MSTTTQQELLALAEQYEQQGKKVAEEYTQKANALRLAAQLTAHANGPRPGAKTPAVTRRALDAAIALRRTQKTRNPKHPGVSANQAQAERSAEMQARLRAILSGGPLSSNQLTVAMRGYGIGKDRVRQILHMMGAHGRRQGLETIWSLKHAPPPKPAARPKPRPRVSRARTAYQPHPRKGYISDKGRAVIQLLKEAGHPLTKRELSVAAKQVGLDGLTGIANWVKCGYLKRSTNGRYSYRADPPQAASAPDLDAPTAPVDVDLDPFAQSPGSYDQPAHVHRQQPEPETPLL